MNDTECTTQLYLFQPQNRQSVEGRFDGGRLSSDAGSILVREVERGSRIIKRFAECFQDHRDPRFTVHPVEQLVGQRVYGLICGHEDVNDHEQLRQDPIFQVLVGKAEELLAGKSTLNRLELSTEAVTKYKKIVCDEKKVDQLLLDVFLESEPRRVRRKAARIILDFDATDVLLHGNQEGKFFHGYYGDYCYLPLYIFCGDHLLMARLRRSNIDASAGTVEELERIIPLIRKKYPNAEIVVRADSAFAREAIMSWCEENKVEYLFGIAKNERLNAEIAKELAEVEKLFCDTQKPVRLFKELSYRTLDSWSRSRRVIAKAEYLEKGPNPRFIVTSLSKKTADAVALYEEWYCKRGDMENRIKEQFSLFADRLSTETMRANQIRLYFSAVAYLLMTELRRKALTGTALEHAQISTIRDKLIKLAARVTVSVRRIYLSFASSFPYRQLFHVAYLRLAQT